MIYKCECGKEFTKPNSFNGHKSHCRIHFEYNGKINKFQEIENKRIKPFVQSAIERAFNKTKLSYEVWTSEEHYCVKCGKVLTEKFGSGRFCSRSCANSRIHSNETKLKIANHINCNKSNSSHINSMNKYLQNPNKCIVCGAAIEYERRHCKTCSKTCQHKRHSDVMKNTRDTYGLMNTIKYRFKYGTYKNVQCDSSWELAFLIYNLEHNINIQRCHEKFKYTLNNEIHLFYPDFIIDTIYYEIKGNEKDFRNSAKIRDFPSNLVLKVLYKDDMQLYLDYCINKYGKEFYTLYDRNYPSWMDKEKS